MTVNLHRTFLAVNEIDDQDTLAFWSDLQRVMDSVHQGMSIVGPWMEARVKVMIRGWLPDGWAVSGPSQIFCPTRPGYRSRSWDVVVHRSLSERSDLPPAASAETGFPLIPKEAVRVVIDSKTNFSNPREYADLTVFNLANNATERQTDFLGPEIVKVLLIAASASGSPDSLLQTGLACGLNAFCLGRYRASPVSDGMERESGWKLARYRDGKFPLQCFKATVLTALADVERRID